MAHIVVNGIKLDWEDYLKLNRDLCTMKLSPESITGIINFDSNKNKSVDNKKEEKKNYTKHVLIERTLTVNGYEFNFIDIETKEFYWSYYSDELDYNMAKESFLNKISGKVKFYLEE